MGGGGGGGVIILDIEAFVFRETPIQMYFDKQ